ncbi:hypothetical protein BC629DRAFT_1076131 [Irpex lacteus]|nr:hypothetical protein BC629DRAFT_1076131 [Irpex lacteus]
MADKTRPEDFQDNLRLDWVFPPPVAEHVHPAYVFTNFAYKIAAARKCSSSLTSHFISMHSVCAAFLSRFFFTVAEQHSSVNGGQFTGVIDLLIARKPSRHFDSLAMADKSRLGDFTDGLRLLILCTLLGLNGPFLAPTVTVEHMQPYVGTSQASHVTHMYRK